VRLGGKVTLHRSFPRVEWCVCLKHCWPAEDSQSPPHRLQEPQKPDDLDGLATFAEWLNEQVSIRIETAEATSRHKPVKDVPVKSVKSKPDKSKGKASSFITTAQRNGGPGITGQKGGTGSQGKVENPKKQPSLMCRTSSVQSVRIHILSVDASSGLPLM
jgi:hypothetical protein